MSCLARDQPDAVILAGTEKPHPAGLGLILSAYPDLPVICTDLNTSTIQVFTGHPINPRFSDLLDAITHLPLRSEPNA